MAVVAPEPALEDEEAYSGPTLISMADFKSRMGVSGPNAAVEAFARLDTDGDGYSKPFPEFLTVTGAMTPPLSVEQAKAVFEQLDANHDRLVSAAEFFNAFSVDAYASEQSPDQKADSYTLEQYRKCLQGMVTAHPAMPLMRAADTNMDLMVDRKEFYQVTRSCSEPPTLTQSVSVFEELDLDHDGWLTELEFAARSSEARLAEK